VRGTLDLEEAFIDASFTGAKKGLAVGPTKRGKGDENPRSRRRWRVERLFGWLHHFRRFVIRWEYHVENFFGMVRLAA